MPRARNPKRELARQLWIESDGKKKLTDIAKELEVGASQIRKWKSEDKWDVDSKRNVTNAQSERYETSKGNQNAKGNRGNKNASAPKGNNNATTHGFFRKMFPNDETLEIATEIMTKNPIDILWENIVVQYTAIVRAQQIMFVESKDDMTKEVRATRSGQIDYRTGSGGGQSEGEEYEIQFAWDKQANFLNAQSRAMQTLGGMIERFKKLASEDDERRKRLEGMEEDLLSAKVKRAEAEARIVENEAGKLEGGGKTNELLQALVSAKKSYHEKINTSDNGEGGDTP